MTEKRSDENLEIDDLFIEDLDAKPRSSRESTSRTSQTRSTPWKPAPLIPTPHEREGWDHRYVRVGFRNEADTINLAQALGDKWEPVLASEYPECFGNIVKDPHARFPDNVEHGGLLLCKRPSEIGRQIAEYANKEVLNQMDAVDRNYLREQLPGMNKLNPERSTRQSQFLDD